MATHGCESGRLNLPFVGHPFDMGQGFRAGALYRYEL